MSDKVSTNFANAKLEGAGKLAPRTGYYFIRAILYRPSSKFGQVPIAIVNWKASEGNFFLDGLEFEIALLHLPTNPKINKDVALENLINRTMFIYGLGIVSKMYNGRPEPFVEFDFDIVDEAPSFMNAKDVKSLALFGKAKTLIEACENFAKNAPYDVALAEDTEANGYEQNYFDPFDGQDDYAYDEVPE